ncbi:hypothetical protein BOS5A_210009 [Bosea sp. EC-HK365B]|nr:hypothetical protein BOS5A_210009 [Bosea sp. EC-HK365B]VXC23700.1 hypothetical protein BOSE127_170561 [Bosea sp. 127]
MPALALLCRHRIMPQICLLIFQCFDNSLPSKRELSKSRG